MGSFIWRLRGSARLNATASDDEILDRVERMLERERKRKIAKGADGLTFSAPFWGDEIGPNWLAMVMYDQGRFWIEPATVGRTLRYDLRSFHSFVFCLFAAAMALIFGIIDDGLEVGAKYAAFAFVWLYGMNLLLAWKRVPRAIRKAVEGP